MTELNPKVKPLDQEPGGIEFNTPDDPARKSERTVPQKSDSAEGKGPDTHPIEPDRTVKKAS